MRRTTITFSPPSNHRRAACPALSTPSIVVRAHVLDRHPLSLGARLASLALRPLLLFSLVWCPGLGLTSSFCSVVLCHLPSIHRVLHRCGQTESLFALSLKLVYKVCQGCSKSASGQDEEAPEEVFVLPEGCGNVKSVRALLCRVPGS